MKVTRIGLDIAKNVFQVHGVDEHERGVMQKQVRRKQLLSFFVQLDRVEGCVVGLEASGGAHYWARELEKLGYRARIMNPIFVKPYVKGHKTDAGDAEAICEAVDRPTMRFVATRSVAQQDLLTIHRLREQAIKWRTALANQTRGLLGEYGLVVAQGLGKLRRRLPELLEDAENELTPLAREHFAEVHAQLLSLDERVKTLTGRLERFATQSEACRRLLTIPGIGALTATAWVAMLGDGRQFNRGRQCAAYLGLTPKQHSSGGKVTLQGISKRGNRYLRTLLIHGARAAARTADKRDDDRCARWAGVVEARRGANIATVALANKNARMAWALLAHGQDYRAAA